MYLQALDNGFVVLEPGVEFISVDNLPKVVSVSCCTNVFSCEICDSVIDSSTHVLLCTYHCKSRGGGGGGRDKGGDLTKI